MRRVIPIFIFRTGITESDLKIVQRQVCYFFFMFAFYSQNKTLPHKNTTQVVQSHIINILRSPN